MDIHRKLKIVRKASTIEVFEVPNEGRWIRRVFKNGLPMASENLSAKSKLGEFIDIVNDHEGTVLKVENERLANALRRHLKRNRVVTGLIIQHRENEK